MNNLNVDEAVATIVHESTHVEYRNKRRILRNTQYEEYRAFVREEIYRNSQNPHISTRPTMKERLDLWDLVLQLYPDLQIGKYPFGGSI